MIVKKFVSWFPALAVAVLLAVATPASAATNPCQGLTDAECAQLTIQADSMKKERAKAEKSSATSVVDEVKDNAESISSIAQIGADIGKAFASAASAVGAEVNNFAKTPVGIISMLIIVWMLMGTQLLIGGGSFIVFIAFNFLLYRFYRRSCFVEQSVEENTGRLDKDGKPITKTRKIYKKLEKTNRGDMEAACFGFFLGTNVVLFIATLIALA